MRHTKTCALLLLVTQAVPGGAQPHLTATSAVDGRLTTAHLQRDRDLKELNRFLATDAARANLASLHVDAAVVSTRLATLDDRELHELAARQRRLEADPAGPRAQRERDLAASCHDGCFD